MRSKLLSLFSSFLLSTTVVSAQSLPSPSGSGQVLQSSASNFALIGDGLHKVSIADSVSTSLLGDLTLECWIYPTSLSGSSGTEMLISRNHTDADFAYSFGLSNNKLSFTQKITGSSNSLTSNSVIPNNTWTHVAVTYSSSTKTANLLINGNIDARATFTGTPIDPAGAALTGLLADPQSGDGSGFVGNATEFRLWNVARTRDQIASAMSGFLPISQTGLVAYYQCGEGSGSSLRDQTNNGNTGTIETGVFYENTSLPFISGLTAIWASSSGNIPDTGEYPVDPTLLSRWRKACAKVRSGAGNAFVLYGGDSITAGVNLTGTSPSYNAAPPGQLRKLLNSYSVPAAEWISWPVGATGFQPADSRWTGVGTAVPDWTTSPGQGPGNGFGVYAASSATTPLSFTPGYTIDHIVVYYATSPGLGNPTVNVDGGATLATITENGTFGWASQSISCTRGTHTINIVPDGVTNQYIFGVWAYDSTTPAVMVCNAGVNAAKASNWVDSTGPQNSLPVIQDLAPDLFILDLSANDSTSRTPIATYQSEIQTILSSVSAYADIVLIAGIPSDPISYGAGTYQTQQFYTSELKSWAAGKYGFINHFARWQSYPYSNALGLYSDSIHPSNIGAADKAVTVFNAIK